MATFSDFTVVVGTARGGYDDIDEAKAEARRLYALNQPDPVTVLGADGEVIYVIKETTDG
jgi:hypothetical protein